MSPRIASLVLGGVIAAAGLGVAPGVAMAGNSSLCNNVTWQCIYDHANFTGLLGHRIAGQGFASVPSNEDDLMSSWENRTSTNGRWFYDETQASTCRTLFKNSELYYVQEPDNDELDAWATNGSC